MNNYGYNVDVHSSASVVEDVIVPVGEEKEIKVITNSAKKFTLRVYDRRDGIPILINGKRYVIIETKSSPLYFYNVVVEPGKNWIKKLLSFQL